MPLIKVIQRNLPNSVLVDGQARAYSVPDPDCYDEIESS
jgi:hypothetical protein